MSNRQLLKEYIRYDISSENFAFFFKVPFSVGKELPTGEIGSGFVDLSLRHNNSPTMKEMLEIAEKYNGTLLGYIVPLADTSRDDARITFDGFNLKVDDKTAEQLAKKLKPDDFFKEKDDTWYFWWD